MIVNVLMRLLQVLMSGLVGELLNTSNSFVYQKIFSEETREEVLANQYSAQIKPLQKQPQKQLLYQYSVQNFSHVPITFLAAGKQFKVVAKGQKAVFDCEEPLTVQLTDQIPPFKIDVSPEQRFNQIGVRGAVVCIVTECVDFQVQITARPRFSLLNYSGVQLFNSQVEGDLQQYYFDERAILSCDQQQTEFCAEDTEI